MWFLLLLCSALPAAVTSQGGRNFLILQNGRDPCEGHVEVYHNGAWGYVGDKYWTEDTEQVACRNAQCGNRLSSMNTLRPTNKTIWLNELNCSESKPYLWDCDKPGWDVSYYPKQTIKKITCSKRITIGLDGYKCAGYVQYSSQDRQSGSSEEGYFCAQNWRQEEAALLCRSLNCGTVKEVNPLEYKQEFPIQSMIVIDCPDVNNLNNLWQCATQPLRCSTRASVICTDHERLQLRGNTTNSCHGQLVREDKEKEGEWIAVQKETDFDACQRMHCGRKVASTLDGDNNIKLECSGRVSVALKDNNRDSRCYGDVHIRVNDSFHPVCGSDWTREDAEVVCRELNCGKVVSHKAKFSSGTGIIDNVKCSGNESSLWHCRAKREPLRCTTKATVVCAEGIDVRLTDGPGKCAGRVEVKYGGEWKRVKDQGWSETESNKVCTHLKCGKMRGSPNSDKFSQGSGEFLPLKVDCQSDTSKVSDCLKEGADSQTSRDQTAIAITCEEHKVVFLKGERPCSGMVGIEHNGGVSWLSDSLWDQNSANAVCREMRCGAAISNSSVSDNSSSIWGESYNCSSNSASLFECEAVKLQDNVTNAIATVTCTGNIMVNLTNKCWGDVNVCLSGECGGVCSDAWTSQKSDMLCRELGCGDAALKATSEQQRSMLIKSLHMTANTASLDQCNFVKADGSMVCSPASVICPGSLKVRFSSVGYKCLGNVEVRYGGQWLPVCTEALADDEIKNNICEELQCGQYIKDLDYFGSTSASNRVISSIQCSASSQKLLSACSVESEKKQCKFGRLQCSNWKQVELISNKACSGAVFVNSAQGRSGVSSQGFGRAEGNLLCQNLQCGSFSSNRTTEFADVPKVTIACEQGAQNILDCVQNASTGPPQELLFVKCEAEPTVTLSSKCSGELKINDVSVCSTNWDKKYAHMVCQENNCSNAIDFNIEFKTSPKPNTKYHHVKCEDFHSNLGQGSRFLGECKDKLVSVYCVGNIEFNTTDHCGGQIEINYDGKWQKVCHVDLSSQWRDKLCEELGCERHNASIRTKNKNKSKKSLSTSLECGTNLNSIKHCVTNKKCQSVPAEIYCAGYVEITPQKTSSSTPIIIGVVGTLLAVVIFVIVARYFFIKNRASSKKVPPIRMWRRDEEFGSGKMDSSHLRRLRHEADFITESERSYSSLSYDDIDHAEGEPLSRQDSADLPSSPAAVNQSSDGETYEVEDPLENYDDIRDSPEATQTEAEVHKSPPAVPDAGAAPLEQEQSSNDYLVPGQDG